MRADILNMLVLPAKAGIQRLQSLDYEIHPCISSCGPALRITSCNSPCRL